MTNEPLWEILDLERELSDDFIFKVHYRATIEIDGIMASKYGAVNLTRPDVLVPFFDLTQDTVIEWLKQRIGQKGIEEILDFLICSIQQKKSPTKAFGLPWAD